VVVVVVQRTWSYDRSTSARYIHRDNAGGRSNDADGFQCTRLLAVRQPGVRLRQPLNALYDVRVPSGDELLPAAVSRHAQLRLVNGCRAARGRLLGHPQSDDVSVLCVADIDDVASHARREPSAEYSDDV